MSCHSVLAARFGEKMVSGRRGEVPAFWWLALTRRWFPGDVLVGAKSQRFDMVAHFGAKLLFGSPVLMGETSECFGGSLIREGGFRESCVGRIEVRTLWWLASARI